ncbi:MAG TPA: bifunctional DNA-formamidopyrimidine glycosylase/DNA-(apurinic or apyrimidinic site) lyase [Rhizobiaceae bacterium]|nr:bifunctional DNA-formamidopyrimidine glycosylase/DNA-(apurinic or apyrimidinic site) lyase [Rhizobiaceae bacterium]
MPELPEVETVRRGLAPAMEGAVFDRVEARRPDLRFPFPRDFAARLQGRRIAALSRRAKYLLADLDDGAVLVMHLGMSGSFRVENEEAATAPGSFYHERGAAGAHDHVVFHLDGPKGRARITYNDPRRFGYMDLIARSALDTHPLFSALGMEPLGNELDGGAIRRLFAGKAAPLKAALLDQRLIAGLGNIYVCEALWQSRLSPLRAAGSLTAAKAAGLSNAIRDVLARAIEAGGSTLRDHRLADGTLGYFQHAFMVYDREGEPCARPACRGVTSRIVQSGRSTFYCPLCQK